MANEVGKAYVSIIASIKGISNDIKRDLKKELAGVEAEIKGKVDFDKSQVTKDAAEAVKQAQHAAPDVKKDINFDGAQATKEAREAIDAARASAPDIKGIKVKLDKEGLIKDVAITVKLAQTTAPPIKLKTEVDKKGFRNGKGLDAGDIGAFVGNLGIGPVRALAKASEDLAFTIGTKLAKSLSEATGVSSTFATSTVNVVGGVIGATVAVGALGLALLALVAIVGTVIGEVLAGVAALAVGLALVIPAAAVPAIAALGAIGLGTDKLGKAFFALASGDTKAFETALGTLSPKLQEFVKAFQPIFDIKDKLGDQLFGGVFDSFAGKLPAAVEKIKVSLIDASGSIGKFFSDTIAQFSTAENTVKIDKLFASVKPALDGLLGGLKPFTQGLLDAASAGAPGFTKLATAIGGVAGKFGEFLTRISNSGALDRLIDAVVRFIDVAGESLIGILEQLVNSGPQFLDTLTAMAPAMEALANAVLQMLQAGGPGLTEFFKALAAELSKPETIKGMIDLGKAMGDFFIALIPLLPALPNIISLMTLFINILATIAPYTPFVLLLTYGLDLLSAAIGALIKWDLAVLSTAWGVLSGAFSMAKDRAKELWDQFTAGLGILRGFLAFIGQMVSSVLSFFSNLFSKVKEIFGNIVSAIGSALSNGFTKAKDGAGKIVTAIKEAFTAAVDKVKQIGKDIIEGLIDGIKAVAKRAKDAAVGVVKDAVDGAKKLLHIGSPSKLWRELGEFSTLGYAIGIENKSFLATKASTDMVRSAYAAVRSARVPTMQIGTRFSGDVEPNDLVQMLIDANATRPVVLMSENSQIARVVNDENKKLARR